MKHYSMKLDGDCVRFTPDGRIAVVDAIKALSARKGAEQIWAAGPETQVAVQLGLRVGVCEDSLRAVARGGLLHDVGKIAIPDEILEKPSALTSAEWRTVVQHPRIGQVILEQAAALKDSVPIILHHHERYAGHGYPYGLRGSEIPVHLMYIEMIDGCLS